MVAENEYRPTKDAYLVKKRLEMAGPILKVWATNAPEAWCQLSEEETNSLGDAVARNGPA
jgi:hypothetical protein